jgi:sugar/nucleoside kinase (ribokinase family)
MKNRMDIIALGSVAMDYYLFLDSLSRVQEKIRARSAEFLPGGTMGNFICAAAKLGMKTGFMGVVGGDGFGQFLKREFERHGVDVSHLRRRSREKTPVTVLVLDDSGNRVNVLPPFIHLGIRDLNDSYMARARILHTHLFDFDVCLHCAQVMNRKGAIFSVDLELQRVRDIPASKLNELLALTQVLFCNEKTLRHLVPITECSRAARILKSRGPRMVAVTLGDKGSLTVNPQGEVFRISAPKVKAVDETGAGDCFAGAFLYGYLKGWPLQKMMHYASVASARVVTQIGARTGQPTLEAFLFQGRSFPARRAIKK